MKRKIIITLLQEFKDNKISLEETVERLLKLDENVESKKVEKNKTIFKLNGQIDLEDLIKEIENEQDKL
jgi:hypothetical protein